MTMAMLIKEAFKWGLITGSEVHYHGRKHDGMWADMVLER